MSHEEYKEMLPVHALGALEAEDVRLLEAHLAECAACRAELNEWSDTAGALAYVAPMVEPSAQLRARILESVRERPQSPSVKTQADNNDNGDSKSSTAPSNVVPIDQRPRRTWNTTMKLGALAASVAFIALIVSLIVVWTRNNALRSEVARLTVRLDKTEEELAREREELARERDDMKVLSASTLTMASLKGMESTAPRARARLAYDHDTGRAVLFAYDLPPAPAGKAYQLWYIADGRPLPGGVFKPDASGQGILRDQVPAEGLNASLFAVTLEPQSGVSQPTGEKYLLGGSS
jgi:anti-sigma-K factor RskA